MVVAANVVCPPKMGTSKRGPGGVSKDTGQSGAPFFLFSALRRSHPRRSPPWVSLEERTLVDGGPSTSDSAEGDSVCSWARIQHTLSSGPIRQNGLYFGARRRRGRGCPVTKLGQLPRVTSRAHLYSCGDTARATTVVFTACSTATSGFTPPTEITGKYYSRRNHVFDKTLLLV